MKNFLISSLVIFTVILVACQPMATPGKAESSPRQQLLEGVWVVEHIGDFPVVTGSPARLQFMEDGAINGNASCNRFFGQYTYSNTVLVVGALGATKMMCLPSLMEQEQRLLERLPNATQVRLENDLLILQDASGTSLITASREEPKAP